MDVHSHARPNQVRVEHLSLDLVLDFAEHRLRGKASFDLLRRDPEAPLILDTLGLQIESVLGADGSKLRFQLGETDPILGAPLRIALQPKDQQVTITYRTSPEAAALQWLSPEQTLGKKLPFLYTQGQAILTRTWIPIQDTPGVRLSFEARVRGPENMRVVMSAAGGEKEKDGSYHFQMQHPIPSYLLALACGDLAFIEISKRCGVYAEANMVVRAAAELADMEKMLQACEQAFGPYRWQRYDVLILPPAFPFGGMENPTLTFATPTIITGDKSLVSLIAHELAHSWSGNLVTNATWRDFWLNEGFTVYLEHRIMELVYGEERAKMEILIGLQALEEEIAKLVPEDQRLHIDLSGRNPDDGMTAIPYDKGAAFLRRLEQVYGRPRFDRFLKDYFDQHAFQSITTVEFESWLQTRLLAADRAKAAQLDVKSWIHASGLPEDIPRPTAKGFLEVDRYRKGWLEGKPPEEIHTVHWITHQWLHFLRGMPEDLSLAQVRKLDADFGFMGLGNGEILTAWFKLAIRRGMDECHGPLREFLQRVGRRKFLKPLYTELVQSQRGRELAEEIYDHAREQYHAIAQRTIDKILE